MEGLSEASTIVTAVKYAYALRDHIEKIRKHPKEKARLKERVESLVSNLESLEIERHDAFYKHIREDLQYVIKLVQSVSTSGAKAWLKPLLKPSEDHEALQKAEGKLDHLLTQCVVIMAQHDLSSSAYDLNLRLPSCKVALKRGEHLLKFLKDGMASNQPLRVIVIHGEAGIGKTTLLNVLWHAASSEPPFCKRAYVQIGEHPKAEDITRLQADICQQLGGKKETYPANSFGQGALKERFKTLKGKNKPVFLAIDNIFKVEHLRSLVPSELAEKDMPSSSCIAVTCRDGSIGNELLRICHLEAEGSSQVLLFKPLFLNPEQSLELFAEFAQMQLSDPGNRKLADTFSCLCGGLPLALQVLGSIFREKEQREPKQWHHIYDQWATFDDPGNKHTSVITKALHVSYELLDTSRQEAFLDIVSSFYGWHWRLVEGIVDKQMMEDLRQSSLISIVKERNQCSESAMRCRHVDIPWPREIRFFEISGYVWMHDMTLRFGESIINDEVNRLGYAEDYQGHQLGYVERPFVGFDSIKITDVRNLILTIGPETSSEQVSALLSSLQHATKLQTLITVISCSPSTIKYRLVGTAKRRYLRLFKHVGEWGEEWSNFLKKVSREIRFIYLCNSDVVQLLSNTLLPHLKVLNVENCRELREIGEMPPSLEGLFLYQCRDLTKISEPAGCMECLEELVVEDCDKLAELPAGFGELRALKRLHLRECRSLTKLPETVGCMQSLEQLWVGYCDNLVELPSGIGKLRSLKKLQLFGCRNVAKLPEAVGCMESLEELWLEICDRLVELPADIGKLRSLKKLRLSICKSLTKLPETVGFMESLEELWVEDCNNLVELPASIGKLRSLKKLQLSKCESLTKLPETVGCMESMQELWVGQCHNLVELPAGIGKLRSLKKLLLFRCTSLTKLPESVGCMESLEELWVACCDSIVELPAGIGALRSLKKLLLTGCRNLAKLPEAVGCMESVEEMCVVGCCDSVVEQAAGFRKLPSLKVCVSCVTGEVDLPEHIEGHSQFRRHRSL